MTRKDKALLGLLIAGGQALKAAQEAIGAAIAVLRDGEEEPPPSEQYQKPRTLGRRHMQEGEAANG